MDLYANFNQKLSPKDQSWIKRGPEGVIVLIYFLGTMTLMIDTVLSTYNNLVSAFDYCGSLSLAIAMTLGMYLIYTEKSDCFKVTSKVYLLFTLYMQGSWFYGLRHAGTSQSDVSLMTSAIYLPVVYLCSHLVLNKHSDIVSWLNYGTTTVLSVYFLGFEQIPDRTKIIVFFALATHPLFLVFLNIVKAFVRTEAVLHSKNKTLEGKLVVDSLTNAGNRTLFNDLNDKYYTQNRPSVLAILDIDHFKKINDQYGHDKGDDVLKFLVRTLSQYLDSDEHIIRWGGEEFILILNDNNQCYRRMQEMRKAIEFTSTAIISEGFTVSIGYHIKEDGFSLKECLQYADQALYKAKNNGRNQIQSMKV